VERCIYLISENRPASRKFYEHCEKQLDLHDCVKFLLAILVHIKRFVKSKQDEQQDEASGGEEASDMEDSVSPLDGSDKENSLIPKGDADTKRAAAKKRRLYNQTNNSEVLEGTSSSSTLSASSSQSNNTLGNSSSNNTTLRSDSTLQATSSSPFSEKLENPSVISGLLDVVCIFWVYRSKELSLTSNGEYKSLVDKKSSKILTLLFKHYKSTEVIGPVVYLCSLLPHSSVSTVAGFCLSRLKSMNLPTAKATEDRFQFDLASLSPISTYTDALCNWGRGDDLFDMIVGWIKKGEL
jgi:hypothetical protein